MYRLEIISEDGLNNAEFTFNSFDEMSAFLKICFDNGHAVLVYEVDE